MSINIQYKNTALKLRRSGKSYSEIMAVVPVAKSTLSYWFKDLALSKKDQTYLKERTAVLQDRARLKGGATMAKRHASRHSKTTHEAEAAFSYYQSDPFFIHGLTLYWAHGATDSQIANGFIFTTSSPAMMRHMTLFTQQFLQVDPTELSFRLYTKQKSKVSEQQRWWSRECVVPKSQFKSPVIQKTTGRSVTREVYRGSLQLRITGSHHRTTIQAWITTLEQHYTQNP